MWRQDVCPECGATLAPFVTDPDDFTGLPYPPLDFSQPKPLPASVGTFLELDFSGDRPAFSLCYGNPESTSPALRLETIKTEPRQPTTDGTQQSSEASEQQPQGSPAGQPRTIDDQLIFCLA